MTSSAAHWPLLGKISYCLKEGMQKRKGRGGLRGDRIISNSFLQMRAALKGFIFMFMGSFGYAAAQK